MSTNVPYTRTLPYVLREQLKQAGVRVLIAEVAAVPDPDHVTIVQEGVQTVIARVSSYVPTVGEPVYCLAADTLIVALGAVGGLPVSTLPKNPTYAQLKRGGP